MAKVKFNLKRSWKSIVSMVLAGVAVLGAIFGVVALSKKLSADTKEIHPTFNVGAIDSQGNYMDSETSIYTKNLFECQGLTIEPDFETTGTFSVYYYAENKTFMGATGDINASDGVYSLDGDYLFAKYARIVITPEIPEKEDKDDFKIRFYQVSGYADDYTITVNKKQKDLNFDYLSDNLYEPCGRGTYSNNIFTEDPSTNRFIGKVHSDDYSKFLVIVPKELYNVSEYETGLIARGIVGDDNEKYTLLVDYKEYQHYDDGVNITFIVDNLAFGILYIQGNLSNVSIDKMNSIEIYAIK